MFLTLFRFPHNGIFSLLLVEYNTSFSYKKFGLLFSTSTLLIFEFPLKNLPTKYGFKLQSFFIFRDLKFFNLKRLQRNHIASSKGGYLVAWINRDFFLALQSIQNFVFAYIERIIDNINFNYLFV